MRGIQVIRGEEVQAEVGVWLARRFSAARVAFFCCDDGSTVLSTVRAGQLVNGYGLLSKHGLHTREEHCMAEHQGQRVPDGFSAPACCAQ